MARPVPYTYIQCPCSDPSSAASPDEASSPLSASSADSERTFNPRAPRSSFSLYPLEYLLYCEDCQQIRCPRCVTEETVTYYCPNCLFEVPSSNLRSEGNRCTRSCYQCPVCVAPLQVSSIRPTPPQPDGDGHSSGGPFALFCQYCSWSSRETGIEFERASGIHSQLAKMENGGAPRLTFREMRERRKDRPEDPPLPDALLNRHLQFASLKAFYHEQLADARAAVAGGLPMRDGLALASSPASLTRIMSLYTGRAAHHHHHHHHGQNGRPADVVREALTTDEGLRLAQLDESSSVDKLALGGWHSTASHQQRLLQPDAVADVRFTDHLCPVPCLLRTKRSKRCPVCRHIISKPEAKVTSTRFKIRLVAKSYMPSIAIRPLSPAAGPIPVGSRPAPAAGPPLAPLRPHQFVLTFRNPLFDAISVTLAIPSLTPGRVASTVTVLCPQFDVGANTDMWDDALRDDATASRDLVTTATTAARRGPADDGPGQAEAGKVWDRGRNWVSIVLEVIPASLRAAVAKGGPLRPDDDVLEIPMFVRVEWEADAQHDMGGPPADRDKDSREKRELAYWCVLGVGRIADD
ncbi:hypothetical protein XA68_16621 [Ophiocordyceps unilateralis]|uniref:Dynactin subunit 4 n=1 Tax=Ophiocordyceps unilateralis TaxID=268505 RepID=A0A2A9PSG2_OPHUN|nr:hypothetical protein XA68_16621 [Ophiocordyceps unilateralis]